MLPSSEAATAKKKTLLPPDVVIGVKASLLYASLPHPTPVRVVTPLTTKIGFSTAVFEAVFTLLSGVGNYFLFPGRRRLMQLFLSPVITEFPPPPH